MSAWPTVHLSDCCEIVSGATPSTTDPAYWGGDICWATPKDLSNLDGVYISDTPRKVTDAGLRSCSAAILPPGSVLFSSRAPIGHVAINTVPMATNQGFKSFIVDPSRVNANFLYYWLRMKRPFLESLGNGATFKEVSKAVVSRIEFPLPPLPTQRRIAAILDHADALRAKRRAALAEVEGLGQAIFREMFSGPHSEEMMRTCALSECAEMKSGVAKGRRLEGRMVITAPYLRVANVQAGFLNLSEIKTIEVLPSELRELILQPGDIVLTEGGDSDKLGRGALWEGQIDGCIHQNHVFRVRPDQSLLLPRFFHEFLKSPSARAYFLRCAKRTTNLASINMTQLRALPSHCFPSRCSVSSFVVLRLWRM